MKNSKLLIEIEEQPDGSDKVNATYTGNDLQMVYGLIEAMKRIPEIASVVVAASELYKEQ